MCDLKRLMLRVMSGQDAVAALTSLAGEVAVHLNHSVAFRNRFGSVDLDFVVALGMQHDGAAQKHRGCESETQDRYPFRI